MNDELSLDGFAHALVKEAGEMMRTAKTEEDLRIGFEKALTPVLKAIGITGSKYERHSGKTASEYRGRPDAIHGKVIIEYEPPRSLSKKGKLEHAEGQLHDYLSAEGYAKGEAVTSLFERPLGVGFDGEQIFFVRFGEESKKKTETYETEGPYEFDRESARTFLMHLRGLSRKPLTPENLAEVFGSDSALAPTVVTAFANALEHWGTGRPRVFFNEWKRLFGIVYGAQFDARKEDEAKALSKHFGVGKDTDFQELLFSVHTYFAYLMKLIAVEILNISDIAFEKSFCAKLTHLKADDFKAALEDIEALIATDGEDESHFLCAIINSGKVRDFIKSYSSADRGFGAPSVMKHVGIPKFESKNELHVKLAGLSKELHELVLAGDQQGEVQTKEKEVNNLVQQIIISRLVENRVG